MGLDCCLVTDVKNVHLDRLYVFIGYGTIEDRKEYKKDEFLRLIEEVYQKVEEDNGLSEEKKDYYKYWLNIAKENAGNRNVLFTDNDDEEWYLDRLPDSGFCASCGWRETRFIRGYLGLLMEVCKRCGNRIS